ncbi:uncharacterized protein LOC141631099 [Silene latifolia]|uniref:uncharacterized protein LOC141631099 n=1 Tax=Silene latifolia TaxID=37657 RepID=UPI003D784A11
MKLRKMGISPHAQCLLCGNGQATHEHLFRRCEYSRKILDGLTDRLHLRRFNPNNGILHWICGRKWTPMKKGINLSIFMAGYYHIWWQRNQVRVEGCFKRPEVLLREIGQCTFLRVKQILPHSLTRRDEVWFQTIDLLY